MALKYKIILILLVIGIMALGGVYGYKAYNNFRFELALKKAAEISPDIWEKKYQDMQIKDKYKVVLITNNGGEYTYAEYFKYAAEKIGWEVVIYYNQTLGHEKEILEFNPDFLIFSQFSSTLPDLNSKINAHHSKKYLLSFSSIDAIRNRFNRVAKIMGACPRDG